MSDIDLDDARDAVRNVIRQFQGQRAAADPAIVKLTRGKLYELFVLAWLLRELRSRGFYISLHGTVLSLKQSPGVIKSGDTYFELQHPATGKQFRLYTDIEVRTLGSSLTGTAQLCSYHEIDIVVVADTASGRPAHTELALGVECKSNVKFRKSILKEALGVKREMGLLSDIQPSSLASAAGSKLPTVPSTPPSEYFVCYVDSDGDHYALSPAAFGIEFKLLRP